MRLPPPLLISSLPLPDVPSSHLLPSFVPLPSRPCSASRLVATRSTVRPARTKLHWGFPAARRGRPMPNPEESSPPLDGWTRHGSRHGVPPGLNPRRKRQPTAKTCLDSQEWVFGTPADSEWAIGRADLTRRAPRAAGNDHGMRDCGDIENCRLCFVWAVYGAV
jgi:hypothetical protein